MLMMVVPLLMNDLDSHMNPVKLLSLTITALRMGNNHFPALIKLGLSDH
jgi:hypothetical protein